MSDTPVPPTLAERALVGLVRGYRLLLSPWLGASCRFAPTCSVYAIEALQRHGAAAGTYLAAARILRCNPFCAGGHDGVPEQAPSLFAHLGLSKAPGPCPSTPLLQKLPHD
ncbi:membrane protein insertion efficiency factor YidD [Roseateles koreensis]|uniref:Putative membrane protein insertion efficiency factor n=1 Tax=Roseateles koreensis TaxID=2987526 RepID=A0ABT5KRQ2_9BURK|nr:membrane protein insertion efficiency factor YidD [Roseateles koreensis]MDC8785591.1 membrane protein insertion efficiency factor YidD [Roseateles koreensis]